MELQQVGHAGVPAARLQEQFVFLQNDHTAAESIAGADQTHWVGLLVPRMATWCRRVALLRIHWKSVAGEFLTCFLLCIRTRDRSILMWYFSPTVFSILTELITIINGLYNYWFSQVAKDQSQFWLSLASFSPDDWNNPKIWRFWMQFHPFIHSFSVLASSCTQGCVCLLEP